MGINPLGSNKKARTTLVFNRDIERLVFKNAGADIATVRNTSTSEAVLSLVLENVATTSKARDIARTMYSCDEPRPRCLDGFEIIFQDLASNGEHGRDSEPVVRSFLELTLDLGLSINTADDDAVLLTEQWHSIVDVLKDASKNKDLDAMLAVRNASQLGAALEAPSAMQAIPSMLSCMLESWEALRTKSCTYRVLSCLARMAFPTRRGIDETAETRLAFLRKADKFYASGEEGSL